jgi:hypothetical protein
VPALASPEGDGSALGVAVSSALEDGLGSGVWLGSGI